MTDCKFEEKQYEWHLNDQLAEKGQVYPSGQHLEYDLGIDSAVFSQNPKFWAMWDRRRAQRWKTGLHLRPELWDTAERILTNNMFPKFKCNIFIQCKRPESISSPYGKEYSYWKQPYLRYEIEDHQQITLQNLEEKISSYAIVVYACLSFWKREDFWRLIENGQIVENSNFVQPRRLRGHRRYTFIQSGKDGYACSEPRKIEGLDILKEIHRMLDQPDQFENNVQFLNNLAKDIKMVIEELDETTRKGFFAIRESMGYSDHELGRSVTTIFAFNLFANTTWGIAFENPQPPSHPIQEVDGRIKGLFDSL